MHCAESSSEPLHGFPFCCGTGSVQVRRRFLTPKSQVVEQSDHGPHCDQPPLTETVHRTTVEMIISLLH